MRAAWYERLGPAREVLEVGDMDMPEPGPGELRVRLAASAVNPSDVKRRLGHIYTLDHPRVIPNSDGAGIVDAAGPGVADGWVGKRVWLYNGQRDGRAFGTAAGYIALAETLVTELPDGTGFAEGACLGIPAMTAHHGVFGNGPVDGLTLLVTGGAGAVGHYAVQLARWGGARVVATVSGDAKAEEARAAGADAVVNYREADAADRILEATAGEGVDRIVEVGFGANMSITERVLKSNGSMSVYAADGGEMDGFPFRFFLTNCVTLQFFVLNSIPLAARDQARHDITRWLGEATPVHRVDGIYPLDRIAEAHEAVERGDKRGTVIVQPGELAANT